MIAFSISFTSIFPSLTYHLHVINFYQKSRRDYKIFRIR